MKNLNKIILVVFMAVTFFSGCNKPSDPDLQVMAVGEWTLIDLLMDDQSIYDGYYYSDAEFTLNLNNDKSCVFINYDGIGFIGTWSITGEALVLTPSNQELQPVNFDIMYTRPDRMGIQRTITSNLIGTVVYTYILEK